MTTPGDAVGPSAKFAVAAVPNPETDAELQIAERSADAGHATVPDVATAVGASGSASPRPSARTHTAPGASSDDGVPVEADEAAVKSDKSSIPGESPGSAPQPAAIRPDSEGPAPDGTADAGPVAGERVTGEPTEVVEQAAPGATRSGDAQSTGTAAGGASALDVTPAAVDAAPAAGADDADAARRAAPPAWPIPDAAPITRPVQDAGPITGAPAATETEAATAPLPATRPAPAGPTSQAGTSTPDAVPESVPDDAVPVSAPVRNLVSALNRLRTAIGGATYPLVMPSADDARQVGAAMVAQLDDYVLPRLARLDAPLLVVIGGSTGAGKSTLVNSLVRQPISAAGVLRPTTRSPVLVCHPSDTGWFRTGDLLPGLTRTTEPGNDPKTLQLVAIDALGPGLAFLDAPDIDSVVDANRALAAQLLAAADLWLFVTTAARYADAVPWELLRTARFRGTVTALVLDRVAPEAAGDISAHLGEMLAAHDLGAAPLFVLPETTLDDRGLLPKDVAAPLHDWFAQLAADSGARAAVVRQTLDGALSALVPAVDGLAAAADEQAVAARALDERVQAAYRNARRTVEQGLQDGRLLRGEVLARWQEFIGTGEFLRSLESRVGRARDRIVAAVTGRPAPGRNLQVALESQLVTLLRGVAADAAEQAYTGWLAHPAGAALLDPTLGRPSVDLPQRAERLVRDWQRNVLEIVRAEAGDKRFVARSAAYAVNATGLAVMIAVFTSTAFIPTGAELAVGAGTTVAAQKVLEAIFGDQAIRTLAAKARDDLLTRVDKLLQVEARRFSARTAAVGLDAEPGAELRQAAKAVGEAREELALTAQVDLRLVDPA